MNFVLDASVTMHWIYPGTPSEAAYATRVLTALGAAEARVPAIWWLEVANVLARAEAKGQASEAETEAFVGMLQKMSIAGDGATIRHALGATLHLARRYGLSSYDAAYLELALREGLPLATLDKELQKAAKQAGVQRFDPK